MKKSKMTNVIFKNVYLFPAFLFGLGYIKPSISYLILFILFFYFSRNAQNLKKDYLGSGIGVLWIVFFLSYFYFFIPPDLPWGRIPLDFYRYFQMALPIILLFFLIIVMPRQLDGLKLIYAISTGMMLFAMGNLTMTLLLLNPPYYGKAYHSINNSIYNSPGTTILGSMLSIVLISFWKKDKTFFNLYNFILLLSIMVSLTISTVFTARTPLFIIILAIFVKIIFEAKSILMVRNAKLFIVLSLISIFFFLLILNFIFPIFFQNLAYRITDGEYSVKIQHHIDYWNQVKNNFWIYPNANWVAKYDWFHNFFFDNHRTSGPITAIISFSIFLLTLIKAIYDFLLHNEYAKEILILLFLFFPFLITTIPWESSESQMIGLYAGITGLVFRKKKTIEEK